MTKEGRTRQDWDFGFVFLGFSTHFPPLSPLPMCINCSKNGAKILHFVAVVKNDVQQKVLGYRASEWSENK